jgi:hypothetical protein
MSSMPSNRVLIIVPAYNEAPNLVSLLPKLRIAGCDIVVVNDSSTDETEDLMKSLRLPSIVLPFNLGIGCAMQTGYRYALAHGYDYAVQVDGDGQHDPQYIPQLLRELKTSNLVIGSRFLNRTGFQSTFFRRIGKRYISLLIWLITGSYFSDPTSGFRACDRSVMKLFANSYPSDYPEPESLLLLNRRRLSIKEVPVEMRAREFGKSSIRFGRSLFYMVKITIVLFLYFFARSAQ